ncbi:MAG: FkbM family methyltransferase [Hydrococcus sp. Prado102]|jgi:FkbM family methyltransferase|nr:FkbM family methyltransferase [Hydrococcus sp. Prado102]
MFTLKKITAKIVNRLLSPLDLKLSRVSERDRLNNKIEKLKKQASEHRASYKSLNAEIEKLQKKDLEHQINYNFWSWLNQQYQINTIIDIGANNGDFAAFLAQKFNPKVVYAFEPLESCLADLEAKKTIIPNLEILNLALSNTNGRANFYQNAYAPSSSLLPVSHYSKDFFPQTAQETSTTVEVAKLDDVLDIEKIPQDILIKIDCQGTEDLVITGGKEIFSVAKCVLIEASFVPMYENQPLFAEIYRILVDLGYRFAGIKNQISEPKTGRPLFAHCLYVRPL